LAQIGDVVRALKPPCPAQPHEHRLADADED
jgi:hypothetical protein